MYLGLIENPVLSMSIIKGMQQVLIMYVLYNPPASLILKKTCSAIPSRSHHPMIGFYIHISIAHVSIYVHYRYLTHLPMAIVQRGNWETETRQTQVLAGGGDFTPW
jgi:hypothetical protein